MISGEITSPCFHVSFHQGAKDYKLPRVHSQQTVAEITGRCWAGPSKVTSSCVQKQLSRSWIQTVTLLKDLSSSFEFLHWKLLQTVQRALQHFWKHLFFLDLMSLYCSYNFCTFLLLHCDTVFEHFTWRDKSIHPWAVRTEANRQTQLKNICSQCNKSALISLLRQVSHSLISMLCLE